MPEPASTGQGLAPMVMTAAERLDEVGRILAAGIRRIRVKRLESQAQSMGEKRECSLDLTGKESVPVRTKTRRGEK